MHWPSAPSSSGAYNGPPPTQTIRPASVCRHGRPSNGPCGPKPHSCLEAAVSDRFQNARLASSQLLGADLPKALFRAGISSVEKSSILWNQPSRSSRS